MSISLAPSPVHLSTSKARSNSGGELLDNEDVLSIMRKKWPGKEFDVRHWSLDPVKGTNGYLGQYFKLRVTCQLENEGDLLNLGFFAKTKPPSHSPQFDFASRSDVMNKEIRVYEELLPRMGAGNGTSWHVDSYFGKTDTILVLEDATLEGYAMPDKYVPFGFEECVILLRSLAKLHSKSLLFEDRLRREQGSTIWEVYGDMLKETLYPHDDAVGANILRPSIAGACCMVELVEPLDDLQKQRAKSRITKWGLHLSRLLESSREFTNVVIHRDVWANNFMLKRDGAGRPVGCYLLDFQFLCYLPPAVDFMFCLHLNARRATRTEHFEAFARLYWDCVREEVEAEGLDIDKSLGWHEFRRSCEAYRALAVTYVAINQQIMLIDQDTAHMYFSKSPELLDKMLRGAEGRCQLVSHLFKTNKEFRERMVENVLDILDYLSDEVP